MSRIRAFLTHFGLSLLIVSLVLTVVLIFWYPPPFFQIIGATDALRILIAVDLVLGPLLTLILFKPGKRGLMFDMSCVAIMQLTALSYGVMVLHEERPYFAVFTADRFEVLAHKDVETDHLASVGLPEKPWRQPIYAVANMPADEAAYQRALEEILFEGAKDIQYRPEFWSTYESGSAQILKKAKPLDDLLLANPDSAAAIHALIEKYDDAGQLAYVPVVGKKQPFALVIDKTSKLPVDIIDANPWRKKAGKNRRQLSSRISD